MIKLSCEVVERCVGRGISTLDSKSTRRWRNRLKDTSGRSSHKHPCRNHFGVVYPPKGVQSLSLSPVFDDSSSMHYADRPYSSYVSRTNWVTSASERTSKEVYTSGSRLLYAARVACISLCFKAANRLPRLPGPSGCAVIHAFRTSERSHRSRSRALPALAKDSARHHKGAGTRLRKRKAFVP